MARTPQQGIISTDDVVAGFDLGKPVPELREAGIDVDDIEIIPAANMLSTAEEEKFMNERVVVEVEDDDDPNSPMFVYTGHNGVTQYIQRGKPQVIKRKFLYSAIAAKRVKFACQFGKLNNGEEFNRLNPSATTAYRIRLIRDDNPQGGMSWFQKVSQSA